MSLTKAAESQWAKPYNNNYLIGLSGSGKRPEMWATVVQCLRSADLNYPADLIEQQFEDGPKQPSSSQSTPERLESPTHAGLSAFYGCALSIEMHEP